jgi:hypothetical protein
MIPLTRLLAFSVLTSASLSLALRVPVADAAPQDPAPRDAAKQVEQEDREAVMRAGLDYVEALYEVKPELIARSVHTDLQKFGFYRRSADEPYRTFPMTYEQLVELAGRWNKSGKQADAESVKKIEVLDLMDQTAVLKVTAVWGVDHMQLGKFDGQWKIRHILWQSHPAD